MGWKQVRASQPMTKLEYCSYRGWELPEGEDPNEMVRVVEYAPEEGKKSNMADKGHVGYVSMSPVSVFDTAYMPNGQLRFGDVVSALKAGLPVRRSSWSADHFIFRQVPAAIGSEIVPKMQSLPEHVKTLFTKSFEKEQLDAIYYNNQIAYVGDSNLVKGYSADAEDILAEYWEGI